MYNFSQEETSEKMTDLLQEPPCSEPGSPESQTRPSPPQSWPIYVSEWRHWRPAWSDGTAGHTTNRRRTRPDRTPFGYRVHPQDSARLIEDPVEQQTIFRLVELAQAPVSLRELCRRLDATGRRRRNGKRWADGGHGLIRELLRRNNAETPAAAKAAVLQRIETIRAKAADWYYPQTLSDDQASARARGERI